MSLFQQNAAPALDITKQRNKQTANTKKKSIPLNEKRLESLSGHFKARMIHETNLEKLTKMPSSELKATLNNLIGNYLVEEKIVISQEDRQELISRIIDESVGYGPIEDLLEDDDITEVLVNGYDDVYYEKEGKLHHADVRFRDEEALRHVIDRIVAPLGRRIDMSSPMVDARLPDGSRVNAVIPPVSLKGALLSIRKFRKDPIRINDLVDFGSLTPDMANFLTSLVRGKLNIVISGGTGSGKTTLLNALACFIAEGERIVTIEDLAELQIPHEHVIGMEAKPANVEGKGEINIRQLVRNALRMRPDRIIVGEVRGAEAFDMLQAMNTGHEGSLTTVHANTPVDAFNRLEAMVMMSSADLPSSIIRSYLVGAIDYVVQIARMPDGKRKMLSIVEVQKDDDGNYGFKEIFTFEKVAGTEADISGYFTSTGEIPVCLPRLKAYGAAVDSAIFDSKKVETK